ncbi:histidine kinase, partial [Gluconobacter japonicus]
AFTVLDIGPLLEGLTELYEASMEEAGLTLDLKLGQIGPVNGDPHLLQQAVANLLDNAIKFAPANSTITLSAAMQNGSVAISVADQGPGMEEQDMMRASERFFRAEAARNTPGAGLGLSLVQAVVHLHGGTMELANGHPGLRVMLSLPVAQKKSTLPA